MENLLKLAIPVLVTYGEKDAAAAGINLFRIEAIRERRKNIRFIQYSGLEHNFFSLDENQEPNYTIENWDKVAQDWLVWLHTN